MARVRARGDLIGTGIGIRDPWPADEPRFAASRATWRCRGEWLFPRVGGDLYQDKPPLFFWLLAICYTVIGSVLWSFLIPAFVATGGVLSLIYISGGAPSAVKRDSLRAACSSAPAVRGRDPWRTDRSVLCFLTTLSLHSLLRHMLLGPRGAGILTRRFRGGARHFTKGVGFLPCLACHSSCCAALAGRMAPVDAGRAGWRWWLAPLAMLLAVCLWFVPMLIAVATKARPNTWHIATKSCSSRP